MATLLFGSDAAAEKRPRDFAQTPSKKIGGDSPRLRRRSVDMVGLDTSLVSLVVPPKPLESIKGLCPPLNTRIARLHS